jgi:uncharacterized protein
VSALLPPTDLASPMESSEAAPYWAATRDHRLVLPWCSGCEAPFWFPRGVCPRCLGTAITWEESTGQGTLYAFSVHRRPGPGRSREDGLYAVALVDLVDNVRVMSNVIGCDDEVLTVGMVVQATWFPLPDGRALPFFAPLESAGGGS